MENKMEAIICSNVNKSYGKKEVLKNIDFTLEKGKKRCWKNNIIIDFIRAESDDGGKCDLERRKDMGKQKSIRSYLFLQRTFNQPVWKWCQFIKSKRVFKKCILLLSELGSENGR